MLYAEVDKTSCINLIAGFMRLVRQGDNPNKKTLIHTHTHTHHIPHLTNN